MCIHQLRAISSIVTIQVQVRVQRNPVLHRSNFLLGGQGSSWLMFNLAQIFTVDLNNQDKLIKVKVRNFDISRFWSVLSDCCSQMLNILQITFILHFLHSIFYDLIWDTTQILLGREENIKLELDSTMSQSWIKFWNWILNFNLKQFVRL